MFFNISGAKGRGDLYEKSVCVWRGGGRRTLLLLLSYDIFTRDGKNTKVHFFTLLLHPYVCFILAPITSICCYHLKMKAGDLLISKLILKKKKFFILYIFLITCPPIFRNHNLRSRVLLIFEVGYYCLKIVVH